MVRQGQRISLYLPGADWGGCSSRAPSHPDKPSTGSSSQDLIKIAKTLHTPKKQQKYQWCNLQFAKSLGNDEEDKKAPGFFSQLLYLVFPPGGYVPLVRCVETQD